MPQLQALIFDLDGTLVDSAPDLRQALNLTLKADGRRGVTLDEVKSMMGDPGYTLLSLAYAATGAPLTEQEIHARFQIFVTHYRRQTADPAQIYPHAVEMLSAFQSSGVKIGLCTNKQEAATHQLIEQLDLKRYFSFIAGGDTFMVHKPHPGHVLGVLGKLEVLAPHAVMVGDSANDILSAHGAGVASIAVAHGYAEVEGLGADAVVESLKDIKSAIQKLGFEFESDPLSSKN